MSKTTTMTALLDQERQRADALETALRHEREVSANWKFACEKVADERATERDRLRDAAAVANRKALEFYADEANWTGTRCLAPATLMYGWDRAQAALADTEPTVGTKTLEVKAQGAICEREHLYWQHLPKCPVCTLQERVNILSRERSGVLHEACVLLDAAKVPIGDLAHRLTLLIENRDEWESTAKRWGNYLEEVRTVLGQHYDNPAVSITDCVTATLDRKDRELQRLPDDLIATRQERDAWQRKHDDLLAELQDPAMESMYKIDTNEVGALLDSLGIPDGGGATLRDRVQYLANTSPHLILSRDEMAWAFCLVEHVLGKELFADHEDDFPTKRAADIMRGAARLLDTAAELGG